MALAGAKPSICPPSIWGGSLSRLVDGIDWINRMRPRPGAVHGTIRVWSPKALQPLARHIHQTRLVTDTSAVTASAPPLRRGALLTREPGSCFRSHSVNPVKPVRWGAVNSRSTGQTYRTPRRGGTVGCPHAAQIRSGDLHPSGLVLKNGRGTLPGDEPLAPDMS